MQKLPSSRRILVASIAAILTQQAASHGATWNGDFDGLWSDAAKWTGGVPNAVDAVADASTIDITANRTITLDGNYTVGTLRFGDATTQSSDWFLTPQNAANTLTLAVTTGVPTLDVVNRTATINAIIAGTAGLTKVGAGTAFLNAVNTYTGTTTVSAGALILGPAGSLATTQVVNSTGGGNGTLGGFIIRRADFYAVPYTITNPTNNTGSGQLTIDAGVVGDVSTGASISGIIRQNSISVGRIGNFGRLIVANGADIQVGNFFLGEQSGKTGQGIQNGGTVDVNGQMRIGHWPQADPVTGTANTTTPNTYTMNGGTLNLSGTFTGSPQGTGEQNGVIYLGIDSTGELIVNNGVISAKALVLDNRGATAGTDRLTINGGTLRIGGAGAGNDVDPLNTGSAIATNNPTTVPATYEVNYTGGTLQASGNFLHSVNAILSDTNGGITFDSAAAANVITTTGVLSGNGSLKKAGPGTLLLRAVNTYTGTTSINGGTLSVTGSLPTAGTVAVNSGGVLSGAGDGLATGLVGNVTVAAGGGIRPGASSADGTFGTVTLAGLTFNGDARFDLNPTDVTTGGGINDLIAVNGTVILNGGTISPVGNAAQTNGTYTILTSTGGITQNALPTVTSPVTRRTYTLSATSNNLQLTVGGTGSLTITWSGGLNANAWDAATTSNWKLATANDQKFYNFDTVTFDDTGVGGTVTLAGTVSPGSTTVNAAQNYTFTGAGGIASGSLTKSGTGTLVLDTTNAYAGTTTITGGKVQVGTGGTTGTLGGTGAIANDGILSFKRSDALTLSRQISGAGSITQDGSNTLTISGANTHFGGVAVNGGTVLVGNDSALGANGSIVTVASGATLDVNSTVPGANRYNISISGSGVPGLAALWSSGTGVVNNPIYSTLTLTGDATIGNNSRYDLNGGTGGTTINAGTFTLTKVGTGEVWWAPNAGATVGNIVVNAGTFGVQSSSNLGSDSFSLIVNPGGLVATFSGITNSKPLQINGGLVASNNVTSTWTGPVLLAGAGTSNRIGTITGGVGVTLAGKISGTGFEVLSTGTNVGVVTLQSAANDWSGDTRITSGILRLEAGGILSPNTTVDLNGGTLDVNTSFQFVAGLKGTSGTILGGGALSVTQAGDTTFGGAISGTTVLAKSGAGSLTLTGTSATTATAFVDGGKLIVNAPFSGGVNVSAAGTLGGTGSVGAVAISGGTVAPGASAGTLTTGAFSLDSLSTLKFELAQPGVVGSGVNDLISVGGNLTLDGTLQVAELGGFGNGTYRLFNYTTLTNNVLNLQPAFLAAHPNSYVDATSIPSQVNLVVVPEPGAFVALLGGCATLLGLRRMRRYSV